MEEVMVFIAKNRSKEQTVHSAGRSGSLAYIGHIVKAFGLLKIYLSYSLAVNHFAKGTVCRVLKRVGGSVGS